METQEVRFGFKAKQKTDANGNPVKDEKGKVVMIPAPPAVMVPVPLFSLDPGPADEKGNPTYLASSQDLQAILDSGDMKQVNLLLDAANEIKLKHVKLQLDEAIQENKDVWPKIRKDKDANGKEIEVIDQPADLSWLSLDKIDWKAIADLPPAQRGARGIPEEIWNAFAEDYKAVIVQHGKTAEQAEAAAKHFLNKFSIVRGNKKVLQALDRNLEIWIANTEKVDEFTEVYQNLRQKLNTLINADEDVIVATV